MITESEYSEACSIIKKYNEQQNYLLDDEEDDGERPCETCGEIGGMINQCCPHYDPLHYKNCGYG